MITRYQLTVTVDVPEEETYSYADMEKMLRRVLRRLEFDSNVVCVATIQVKE